MAVSAAVSRWAAPQPLQSPVREGLPTAFSGVSARTGREPVVPPGVVLTAQELNYNRQCVYSPIPRDVTYFTQPTADWQRRYEAVRAAVVERLAAAVVADRFGYTAGYVHLLRHQFRTGKIDFGEPPLEGTPARRRVTRAHRQQIRAWREQRLSAGEIAQLLSAAGVELSVRTVERILAEEGFPKLPRRTGSRERPPAVLMPGDGDPLRENRC